jgi:hypothetical protein
MVSRTQDANVGFGLDFSDIHGLTVTKVKRDLFRRMAQTQNGITLTDLQDLAKMKQDPLPAILGALQDGKHHPITTSPQGVHPAGRPHT